MKWILFTALLLCPATAISDFNESQTNPFNEDHPTLGWSLIPNSRSIWKKFFGEQLLFSVPLEIDSSGRRKSIEIKNAKKSLLLFGDSNVFGEGLENRATLAWQLQNFLPKTNVYNYGNRGWGVQQFWQLTKMKNFSKEIIGKNSIAIYFFMSWHIDRLVGASNESFLENSPYLSLNSKDEVVNNGRFKDAQPLFTKIKRFFANLSLVKKYNLFIPKPREKDHILLCKIFTEAAHKLKESYQIPLIIVLHPTFGSSLTKLPACFFNPQWQILDFRNLFTGIPEEKFMIAPPIERHMSAYGNYLLAKSLAEKLSAQAGSK